MKETKETIRELLQRMKLGVLPPRFCNYTDEEAYIEFGVICHLFKASSEAERANVAKYVKQLYAEGEFHYSKDWTESRTEENGEMIAYKYPRLLYVKSQ